MVPAEEVDVGHSTAGVHPHHCRAVRTLEVGLDDLIEFAVTERQERGTVLPMRDVSQCSSVLGERLCAHVGVSCRETLLASHD